MRYLFFDIECCDGRHICEFGYVLADEKLNVIEKNVVTINPEKKFRLVGRDDRADLELCFSQEVYRNSPKFPYFYKRIKKLLEYPDQIIAGFALQNDALFLKIACERYRLKPIDFDFVDLQKVFRIYTEGTFSVSLEKVLEKLEIPKIENQHRSDEDSLGTLMILKKICPEEGSSAQTVDKLFPNACGSSKKINSMYTGNSLSGMLSALDRDESTLSVRKKENLFKQFLGCVQPTGEIKENIFNEKSLCFNQQFEKKHLREAIILIQMLADRGCRYSTKVSVNNYYVATQEELESTEINEHSRYFAATQCQERNTLEIITVDKLCEMLGIKREDLSKMSVPKISKEKKAKPARVDFSTGKINATIGDLIKTAV